MVGNFQPSCPLPEDLTGGFAMPRDDGDTYFMLANTDGSGEYACRGGLGMFA
jgi:hypothetical protein